MDQLRLWGDDLSQPPTPKFRPIHYLGSKLRLLEPIVNLIDEVDPSRGLVCDLFAGSGTVSAGLSARRPVVAVDVQEYSRVLCSAILSPQEAILENANRLLKTATASELRERMEWALDPLIQHEERCLRSTNSYDAEALCDLLERGSLLVSGEGPPRNESRMLDDVMLSAKARLTELGLSDSPNSMITRYFGGVYFSYLQAIHLDVLRGCIATFANGDVLLAALLSTASDVVNTVGKQFAQPIRPRSRDGTPKRHLARKIRGDRSQSVFDTYGRWIEAYAALDKSMHNGFAIRADYRDFLSSFDGDLSVVYADPPYTRDHYSRFYHVLESICLRDSPKVSLVSTAQGLRPSRGLYRAERHQSPFCIRSQAPAAFEELFRQVRAREAPLILSYSPYSEENGAHPRLMSVDTLELRAKHFYSRVELVSAGSFAHSKLNRTGLHKEASFEAELLLICEP